MKKELVEKYWDLFRKLSKLCVVKEQVKSQCSIIGRMECLLLQTLKKADEPLCMNDLAEALEVSHSRITRIVDNLVRKNLVERFPSQKDRRKWLTKLTLEGDAASSNDCEVSFNLQRKLLKKLPEEKHYEIMENIELYFNTFIEVLNNEVKNAKNNNC